MMVARHGSRKARIEGLQKKVAGLSDGVAALEKAGDWDEDKHPRDHGKFTESGGGGKGSKDGGTKGKGKVIDAGVDTHGGGSPYKVGSRVDVPVFDRKGDRSFVGGTVTKTSGEYHTVALDRGGSKRFHFSDLASPEKKK